MTNYVKIAKTVKHNGVYYRPYSLIPITNEYDLDYLVKQGAWIESKGEVVDTPQEEHEEVKKTYTREELERLKVAEIKVIADELGKTYPRSITKDKIINVVLGVE